MYRPLPSTLTKWKLISDRKFDLKFVLIYLNIGILNYKFQLENTIF